MENLILWGFISALVLTCLIKVGLLLLNMRYVRAHAGQVPERLKGQVTESAAAQAAKYTLTNGRHQLVCLLFDLVVLTALLLTGAFGAWADCIAGWITRPLWILSIEHLRGVVFLVSLAAAAQAAELPFGLYKTFVIEARFGFNRSTFRLWAADKAKELVLTVVLFTPLLLGLFWIIDLTGSLWWLWSAGFIIGTMLLWIVIAPTLIMPLFNRFEPIKDEALAAEIRRLCKSLKFPLRELYQMDNSQRSTKANAFFFGFGRTQRVVLFDTLIEQLSTQEILAVLAHEIGHQRKGHMRRMLLCTCVLVFVGFGVLGLLAGWAPLYTAFGFSGSSWGAALLIFGLLSELALFYTAPLLSWTSRKFEYEADHFAVDAVRSGKPLADALLKITQTSLGSLWSHPLYRCWYYSHPPLIERLEAIERRAQQLK